MKYGVLPSQARPAIPQPPASAVAFSDYWLGASELRDVVVAEMAKNQWGPTMLADKAECDLKTVCAFLNGLVPAPRKLATFFGFRRVHAYMRVA